MTSNGNRPVVDFYFDFISPYSYLAATQMPAFAEKHAVEVNWLPLNLPRLMSLSGNVSPATIKNKAIYSLRDLKRWAAYLDVPFKMIRPGTFDSRPALRIAGALHGSDRATFCLAAFESIWSGAVDPTAGDCLEQVVSLKELPDEWLQLKNEDFEPNTHAALKAGAFGVPSFILKKERGRPELFFGVDHMDFLSRACE
ncbi:2-hydroxychromene-2-carboxylate isomerase [Mariprofundus sp. NF]|uniref:2-hydroxychromene-2-carboxylate isomerase n=1 Tax=Mariprofundus sp. NF TaxID=2608716 RepID=UPI0015A2107F|nr:2-hydroxychromene-2-carboxylate isomerase [Mariprofundus sp. NF]NWF38844.1 2-hydroxychromene-2-carboxylate isomerase [Mariprofundus sp. NF]